MKPNRSYEPHVRFGQPARFQSNNSNVGDVELSTHESGEWVAMAGSVERPTLSLEHV
jgi:hypothetical protein